jgi:hypothetical protein
MEVTMAKTNKEKAIAEMAKRGEIVRPCEKSKVVREFGGVLIRKRVRDRSPVGGLFAPIGQ